MALIGVRRKGDATTTGFDKFNGDYTMEWQYQYSSKLSGNLPENYRVIAGYTNNDVVDFEIDPRDLIGEIIGIVPVARKYRETPCCCC